MCMEAIEIGQSGREWRIEWRRGADTEGTSRVAIVRAGTPWAAESKLRSHLTRNFRFASGVEIVDIDATD
jgi:hypothetical protein